MNTRFAAHLLLRRIRQPIDQQILDHDALLLVDIVEEISGTTAFVVGEFGLERLASFDASALLHPFEGVAIAVCVDFEDDVLAVPAPEVVKFVYAAACDHLCWSVWRLVEFGEAM